MAKTEPEGPRGFAVILQQMDDGALHAELSETLQSLSAELERHASRFESKAKGELTLKLSLVVSPNGTVAVVADVKTKAPKAPRAGSMFFLTKDSNLSLENPRQQKLPLREVREVAITAPVVRDVADEARPARSV